MIEKLNHTIQNLRIEHTHFNVNDVLVHIDPSDKKLVFAEESMLFSINEFPKRILSETTKWLKESGVNALCCTMQYVELTLGEKHVKTPVVLFPLEFKINKQKNQISFIKIEEEQFLNPFLIFHLEQTLGLVAPSDVENMCSFLLENQFEVNQLDQKLIGNFHHHRYQIVKELDEILGLSDFAPPLKTILGFGDSETNTTINLIPDTLFFADVDHENVFDKLSTSDIVVQGPPGTGKSQVLSNILGKLIAQNKTTIVVSEKKAALEVLKNKLGDFNLDQLCFIATSDHLSHRFFKELKATWDYYEVYNSKHTTNIRLSEQYIDQLQMTLDLLAQDDLIGGISFSAFFEAAKTLKLEHGIYNSNVDSIKDFNGVKKIISTVYADKLDTILGNLKHSTLNSSTFHTLDAKVDTWINQLTQLEQIFDLSEWVDLQKLTKEAIQCQIFENEYYKKYNPLFEPNSKKQRKFLQLRKKFVKTKIELEQIQKERTHWKIVPSEIETITLLDSLQKSSLTNRIKTKKRWKEISHLPYDVAQIELESHLKNLVVYRSLSQLKIEFCDLGVDEPEVDVDQIFITINALSTKDWEDLAKVPVEKRTKITASHAVLDGLQRDLNTYFNLDNSTDVLGYLGQLKIAFGQLVASNNQYKLLSQNALNGLKRNANFDMFEHEIYGSHHAQFKDRFPNLAKFSMEDLSSKIDEIIQLQANEARLFSNQLEEQISTKFKEYHQLLTTPSRKLNTQQKALKVTLRKGKSILVKEFSKSRSHPTLREIYNSEARIWIQLLKPIWLSNPVQLAKCFPMEAGLFDVAIFDEASQIPLQNALGAIQRSSRIIIAGDEHQMGPSSYFKSGSREPMDLLHQANYHLKKVTLTHHYRSSQPDLIAFSNKHIYNNQLNAYPSFQPEKPIQHVYCENGISINRQNEVEAIAMAKSIETRLTHTDTIGIVAFSEDQLNCIWNQLSAQTQETIAQRIEQNTAFFKALENVQGDECDHLMISFGFSKNENDDFQHRFGPMNTVNGRKRLNVLVTRAKKTIAFYCSITSKDFKLSDNESVNLLRQWIQFSETYQESEQQTFPHQLQPKIKDNTIQFTAIQNKLASAKELVTLQNVLSERGWTVTYN